MTDSLSQFTVSIADTAILPLVKRFFQSQGMRSQAAKSDDVVIIRDAAANNIIIGALRLCPVNGSWLLRSMSIDKDYQRQGLGLYMLEQIKTTLKDKQCYCFPYCHLESFYQAAGFIKTQASDADSGIEQLYKQYTEKGKQLLIMRYS